MAPVTDGIREARAKAAGGADAGVADATRQAVPAAHLATCIAKSKL